jgi:hypothetical protein
MNKDPSNHPRGRFFLAPFLLIHWLAMADKKDRAQKRIKKIDLKPGDRFKHYKGGGYEYEIVACALSEDTLEPLVIYKNLKKGTVWARTLHNWSEEVEFGGKRVKRFEKME